MKNENLLKKYCSAGISADKNLINANYMSRPIKP